jgi:hypothetical protein
MNERASRDLRDGGGRSRRHGDAQQEDGVSQLDLSAAIADTHVIGRRTSHEFVRDTLRRAIVSGLLPSGTRLVQTDLVGLGCAWISRKVLEQVEFNPGTWEKLKEECDV